MQCYSLCLQVLEQSVVELHPSKLRLDKKSFDFPIICRDSPRFHNQRCGWTLDMGLYEGYRGRQVMVPLLNEAEGFWESWIALLNRDRGHRYALGRPITPWAIRLPALPVGCPPSSVSA